MEATRQDELIERLSKRLREYEKFHSSVELCVSQEASMKLPRETSKNEPLMWYQMRTRSLVLLKRFSHYIFYPLYLVNLLVAIYALNLELYDWHHSIELVTGYMSISFLIVSFFLIFSYLLQYPLSLTCLDTLDGTINKPGILTFALQLFVYSMELSCILSNTLFQDFILYESEVKLFLGVAMRNSGTNAMWMNNVQQHYSCCGRVSYTEYTDIPNSCCEIGVCSETNVFESGCKDMLVEKYFNEYHIYLNTALTLFIVNVVEEIVLISVNLFKN